MRWTSCASTRSARCRWTPSSRRTPATRARRWRWRRSPTCSTRASCGTRPSSPTGPTATASCSPAGTRRCCSTRRCTWPATTSRSTTSSTSASSARRAPGHPEYGHAPGVETTTGPLGQGISTAVGMALGERMLAARFNRGEHAPIDHFTYFIASDGDLEEGIASEASSLAGHLGLGKPDRLLRRQPHLDRGRHRARVLRGRRRALRGLRLARAEPARGPRARHARGRDRRRAGRDRPAEPDHRAHAHRARLAEQAGHARRARRAARRGGDPAHQGGLRLAEPRAVLRPRRGARALPRLRRARRASSEAEWQRALRRLPRASTRDEAAELERMARARAARRLRRRRAAEGPGRGHDRHAQGVAGGDPVGRRARCPSWSAARPTSRPRRSR